MSYLRVFFLSLLGFTAPILISVTLLLLRARQEVVATHREVAPRDVALAAMDDVPVSSNDDSSEIDEVANSVFVVQPTDNALSPVNDYSFVVSFLVRFDRLPAPGKRTNLLSKYDRQGASHAGWAIGIRRYSTSIRPEIYIRGSDGKGGWLTFADYPFRAGEWYNVTAIVRRVDAVSLFVQPMFAPRTRELKNGWTEISEAPRKQGDVQFLGGYPIADIDLPADSNQLVLGSEKRAGSVFRGSISNLLIASLSDFPVDVNKLPSALDGGSLELRQRLASDSIALWVGENGRDESRYAREVRSSTVGTS